MDEMMKPELMKCAVSLWVATRRQGTKTWRLVKDVRADCKVREAAQQQHSASPTQAVQAAGAGSAALENSLLADVGGPGSASPSQAAPPAPSRAEQPELSTHTHI